MRTAVYAALTVTIFAASAAFGAGAKQATTNGSFLRYRANSAQELASMIRSDPSVAARYARHFGTTSYGVSDYFGKRLTLIRLRRPTTAYVYYYNSRGNVTRGRRVMPAGTLVFATQSGEPVLDWRCGNPLRSDLPIRQAIKPTDKNPSMAKMTPMTGTKNATASKFIKVAEAPPDADRIVEKVLATTPAELAPIATIAPTTAEVAEAMPIATGTTIPAVAGGTLPPIAEMASIPTVGAVGAAPGVASGSSGFSWLFPLAALGGGFAAASKKPSTHEVTPPTQPVPEPSSVLPLAASFATACTAIFRRRRSFLRN